MCSEAFKELWHPASVPYFHLLRLEKFRWPSSLENNNIFQSQKWLYPITILPPVLHPCPIYLSTWREVKVKEERKRESGQRGRQPCCEQTHDSCGFVRLKKKTNHLWNGQGETWYLRVGKEWKVVPDLVLTSPWDNCLSQTISHCVFCQLSTANDS